MNRRKVAKKELTSRSDASSRWTAFVPGKQNSADKH